MTKTEKILKYLLLGVIFLWATGKILSQTPMEQNVYDKFIANRVFIQENYGTHVDTTNTIIEITNQEIILTNLDVTTGIVIDKRFIPISMNKVGEYNPKEYTLICTGTNGVTYIVAKENNLMLEFTINTNAAIMSFYNDNYIKLNSLIRKSYDKD